MTEEKLNDMSNDWAITSPKPQSRMYSHPIYDDVVFESDKPMPCRWHTYEGQLVIADRDVVIMPSKEKYSLLVYGKALSKVEANSLGDVVEVVVYEPGWVASIDRETLIAHGVDWEPQHGDTCSLGIIID